MRYKIKITTFNDGKKQYDAFVKVNWFKWKDLNPSQRFLSRENTLEAINNHFDNEVKKIEAKYTKK